MAIRDKLKRTFGSKKNPSGDTTLQGTTPPLRKDIEYYKPHEIPKSKYRGKVDKAHQDMLDAYSFADAFTATGRRASQALSGTFSPGGTHAQSAAPSAAHSRRSSWTSRKQSSLSTATSDGIHVEEAEYREKSLARLAEAETNSPDTSNIDLSRTVTADHSDLPEIHVQRTITLGKPSTSPPDTPFTVEDLQQAMTRASMRPRRGTVLGPAIQPEEVAVVA